MQQFDVSGAFGKCTKVREYPSCLRHESVLAWESSGGNEGLREQEIAGLDSILTVSAHRRYYFCNVTLQVALRRVYVCNSTAVVGSCAGLQLLFSRPEAKRLPWWALMTSSRRQNYNGPSAYDLQGFSGCGMRRPGRLLN